MLKDNFRNRVTQDPVLHSTVVTFLPTVIKSRKLDLQLLC